MRLNNKRYLAKAKANRERLLKGTMYPLIYSPRAEAFVRLSTINKNPFSLSKCLSLSTKRYRIQELYKFFNEQAVSYTDLVNCGVWSKNTLKEWFQGTTPNLQPSDADIIKIVSIFSDRE